MRVLAVVLAVAVTIYALILALRAPSSRLPAGLNKGIWAAFIILVPILGPLVFLISYLLLNGGKAKPATPDYLGPLSKNQKKTGPLAPDDDPEFLKKLDEELRHQSYDKRLRDHESHEDESDDDGEQPAR